MVFFAFHHLNSMVGLHYFINYLGKCHISIQNVACIFTTGIAPNGAWMLSRDCRLYTTTTTQQRLLIGETATCRKPKGLLIDFLKNQKIITSADVSLKKQWRHKIFLTNLQRKKLIPFWSRTPKPLSKLELIKQKIQLLKTWQICTTRFDFILVGITSSR